MEPDEDGTIDKQWVRIDLLYVTSFLNRDPSHPKCPVKQLLNGGRVDDEFTGSRG